LKNLCRFWFESGSGLLVFKCLGFERAPVGRRKLTSGGAHIALASGRSLEGTCAVSPADWPPINQPACPANTIDTSRLFARRRRRRPAGQPLVS